MRFSLLAGIACAALCAASAASAKIVTITDVEIPNASTIGLSDADAPGLNGTFYLGRVKMTDSNGNVYYVNCDDIFHEIGLGSGQNLQFDIGGPITDDNNGHPLSDDVADHMAWINLQSLHSFDPNVWSGAAAAIWQVEFGPNLHETIGDSTIAAIAASFEASPMRVDHTQYTTRFTSLGGLQNQFGGGVPEPATWAMMILGFGGLGLALRRNRAQPALA